MWNQHPSHPLYTSYVNTMDYDSESSEATISLEFAEKQTTNMCMEAVKQNGLQLEFVEQQLPKICLAAVQQNGLALEFVEYQTEFLCLEAVKQNGLALEFVEEQTDEICMEAVKQNGLALEFVEYQTQEICMEAVRQDGVAIQYVFYPTMELCEAAFQQTILARYYMVKPFQEEFIDKIRPTHLESLPDTIAISDVADPITLEPLVADTIYGWIVEHGRWYLAGSLKTINKMIATNYKDSSLDAVFIPIKNSLFPVSELHWVRV